MAARQEELADLRDKKLHLVGNYVHDSVPVSNDEVRTRTPAAPPAVPAPRLTLPRLPPASAQDADNAVVSTWGTPVTPTEFHPHHHLLWMIGGYEPARGSSVAGHRGYFLTGPGMLLNQALIQFATTFLLRRDYKPVQPPYFMNKEGARAARRGGRDRGATPPQHCPPHHAPPAAHAQRWPRWHSWPTLTRRSTTSLGKAPTRRST